MMSKSKIILLILSVGFVFLIYACEDQPQTIKKSAPDEVSGRIIQPVVPNKPAKDNKSPKDDKSPKNVQTGKLNSKSNQIPKDESKVKAEIENILQVTEQTSDGQKPVIPKKAHYDSQGKIDPFKALIQDKPEETKPVVDEGPKRILTPLEKIELSQIRLVAVIIMKNKRIAMVEEATGKGYEIGIGTYMGKNRGKVSEIKDSSIVIKELVKDYKGRLREQVQEIKLNKIDDEE